MAKERGKTTVVNMRHTEQWDQCIDRRTIFGNPFKIGKDCTREESIARYRAMFYRLIKNSKSFKEQVLALKGKRLGCWCKPKPCHGDVIVEYLGHHDVVVEYLEGLKNEQ